jgi:hypothetical protein
MTQENNFLPETFRTNKHNEKYLYHVNRNAFHGEKSADIFKQHFTDKLLNNETFYIILGTDSGLLIRHIIEQRKQVKDTRYLFIELPELIDTIRPLFSDEELGENILLTTVDEWQDKALEFNINVYIYKNKVSYIKSIAAIDAYITNYHQATLTIEQELHSLLFFTQAQLGVSPFMSTQLRNICENRYPIAPLVKDSFKGKTCILLAGGPSLDENMAWIKENQNNFIIIAVSRIAKRLLQEDLIPHIIFSVDPYDVSFDVSKELLKFPSKVVFLHAECVTPHLLSQWHGKSAFLGKRFPWQEDCDKDNFSVGGPTVTNAALQAAIGMGFSDILLAGVDLCFAKSGVTHAAGSNEAKVGPTLGNSGVWVETYAGDTAETLIVFDYARDSLARQAEEAKTQFNINIYNLSSNAAKVEHISHVPTQALSFEDDSSDLWLKVTQLLPQESADLIKQDNYFVLNKVSSMLKKVQAIHLLVKEALECNVKLFDKREVNNYKHKIRMDKIEHKLNSRYQKASSFIKNFGIDKFVLSTQSDTSEEWSDEKVADTGRIYYEAYIYSCVKLIDLLAQTKARIQSRIEEAKEQPDFCLLFTQWEKDLQHGRAKLWKENKLYQHTVVSEQFETKFQQFNDIFIERLNNSETKHLKRTKAEASLAGVRRKIITLYHQRNLEALQVLATSLQNFDHTNEQAKALLILCSAYANLAHNNFDNALSYFLQLPQEYILEDELQQIAKLSIKLHKLEQAEMSMYQLSTIDSSYLLQYAKLLKLLGKTQAAIDAFSDYLSQKPEDIMSWLRLGKIYSEVGAFDSAKLAFQMVLAKEPDNSTALEQLNHIATR